MASSDNAVPQDLRPDGLDATVFTEPGQHWWERLPPDFARRHERFDLAGPNRLRVGTTAAADVVLRTGAASMVGSLALPRGFHPFELARSVRDLPFYGPMAEAGDASKFFKAPPRGMRVRSSKADWFPRFEPDDGVCETLRFDSPFMPALPRLHRSYLKAKANRVAHARYWRHHGAPRPTIIAVHGFSADLYLVNEWIFALPWFYRMGFDVMLFTLPFHGERQSKASPFSGYGYFAGGPSHINEAVRQSVLDLRIFIDWLLEVRGAPQVGLMGISLGGYTTAIATAAEPRLAFAIPNVPVVSFPDLVLEWQPIGTFIRAGLKVVGKSIVDARRLLAVSNPLSYPPAIAKERLMIVGGAGDRLAPPKHSKALWEHWGKPALHWFPGSHLLHFDRDAYLVRIAEFLHAIGFRPPR